MQYLLKHKWFQTSVLFLVAAALVGCSAEAKRARHLKRAEEYFKKGQYVKAELEYVNVGRLSKTLDPKLVARLATIYYEQGRPVEGFALFTNAVRLNPDDLELRYKAGAVWNVLNGWSNAFESAIFILDRNPQHHDARILLAESAQNPEMVTIARQKLNDILRTNGESWSIHLGLALLAQHERQTNLVEQEVQAAARLGPAEPFVNQMQAGLAAARNQQSEVEKFLRVASENARPRTLQRLLLAQYFYERTNAAQAKAILDKQLKETPDYVPASALQARVAFSQTNFTEVSRIAQEILRWNPGSYELRLIQARAWLLQKQSAKALEEFARLEKLYPRVPELKYEIAVALVQNGAVDQAIRKLDEVITQYPGYRAAIILRSELQLRTGAADQAVAALGPLVKRDPGLVGAELSLANAYRVTGKLDEALGIYRRLIARFPSAPEFHFFAGTLLAQQKKPELARNEFEQAIRISSRYFPAVEQVVYLDVEKGDFASARRHVDEQLKLTTNSPQAVLLHAKVCFAQKDMKAAELALTQVIQAAPEASEPYSLLAAIYLSQGTPEKALAQLHSAFEKDPKNPALLVLIGTIEESVKSYDKAQKAYEDAIKLNPKFPAALNNLAYLLCEHSNDPDAALPHASKAAELAPNDAAIKDTFGWVLYRRGEFSRALPILADSAASDSLRNNVEAQYHFAMASYSMNSHAEARAVFARVVELDKAFAGTKGVSRRLAVLDSAANASAVPVLEGAVKDDPKDFLATWKLGQAYQDGGNNEKARTAFETASKLNPQSTEPLLALAALNADRLNDLPRAMEAARAARKLAPNDPVVAGVFGRLAYRTGDYASSVVSLQEYVRSPKADAEAYYDMALSFYAIGEFQLARSNLDRYIADRRGSHVADARNLLILMDFYNGKGDASPVATIASARLQQDKNDLPALLALGLIDQKNAKYDEAAQKFERIVTASKAFSPALRQLTILYGEHLEKDARAIEYGAKARQAYPGDPEISRAIGKAAYRQGDYRSAAQLLDEVAKQRPTDGEALFFLGMSHSKLRQFSQAKVALTQALSAKLEAKYAAQANAALKDLPSK